MKTVALIPIKLGSVRVPQKNIKPFFDGTPLMYFFRRRAWRQRILMKYISTAQMKL